MSTSRSRRVLTILALLGLALSTEGCNVTVGNSERDAQREAIGEVVGDGALTIDLTSPPSREELALMDGRESVVLEREQSRPVDVTVVFHDGKRLSVPARWIAVHAADPEAAPTSVTIRRSGEGLDHLRGALDEAVTGLGVSRAEAEAILEESAGATDGRADVMRSVPTSVRTPDRLSLRTIAKANREEYAVNYLVEWDAS
jgi:hypothetical protein